MDELKGLMQIIHTNNMEFHRLVKRSKYRVDLQDVKVVNVNPNPQMNITISPMAMDNIEVEVDTLPNTPRDSDSNQIMSHFEAARRRTSISRFYSDHGPREDWDAPLNKFVKVNEVRNRRNSQNKTAITLLENMLPCQSLITENESMDLLSKVKHLFYW